MLLIGCAKLNRSYISMNLLGLQGIIIYDLTISRKTTINKKTKFNFSNSSVGYHGQYIIPYIGYQTRLLKCYFFLNLFAVYCWQRGVHWNPVIFRISEKNPCLKMYYSKTEGRKPLQRPHVQTCWTKH